MSKTSNLSHLIPVRRDPAAELKAAAHSLTQFAGKRESSLFKDVILSIFSNRARAKVESHRAATRNVVLKAIKTIKSHHLYIEKLKKGTDEERQLADSVLSAISQYHSALDNAPNQRIPWRLRVKAFFYGASIVQELSAHRIDLPTNPAYWLHIKQEEADERVRHAFQAQFSSPAESRHDPLLAQEGDALRMKANTLMKQYGIRFKNTADALSSVHSAPIRATYDQTSQTSTLCLMLDVIPGTTVRVQGSFRRDVAAQSLPISDSFQLSFQNEQTGYPFPVQYNGWAFSGCCVPAFPHNLEHLPLFKILYARQKKVAHELSPSGQKVEQAKQLLLLRKEVLDANRAEFLKLHRELFHAMLESALEKQPRTEEVNAPILDRYFDQLESQTEPFEHLSETFCLINAYFVEGPWRKLQAAITESQYPDLFAADINVVQQTARRILQDEFLRVVAVLRKEKEEAVSSPVTIDFILCMGMALSPSFHVIMLQNSSETLRCAPPMLDDFAQIIQLGVYAQLQVFLDEMDWSLESRSKEQWQDIMLACMRQQMRDDIALFRAASFDSANHPNIALVEELEGYFNSCFYSTLD